MSRTAGHTDATTALEPWETILFRLWDAVTTERTRRGKAAAMALADRAYKEALRAEEESGRAVAGGVTPHKSR